MGSDAHRSRAATPGARPRSSCKSNPQHTMSHGAPLACLRPQASQSRSESCRRLASGYCAIKWRMNSTSAAVITRPRWPNSPSVPRSVAESKLERRHLPPLFSTHHAHRPPRRCRRVAVGSPAANNTRSWCAARLRATSRGLRPSDHQRKRPFDNRFCASQKPLAIIEC